MLSHITHHTDNPGAMFKWFGVVETRGDKSCDVMEWLFDSYMHVIRTLDLFKTTDNNDKSLVRSHSS